MKRILLLILCVCCLSSCNFLGPVQTPAVRTYELNSLPRSIPKKAKRPIILLVMQPDTVAAYDTPQMAYQLYNYQIAYFAQNRWIARPGVMLQPLIVRSLQKTGRFKAVVTPPSMGRYDYILSTQIMRLQQDYRFNPGKMRFQARVQLIKARSNRIIATYEFSYVTPIIPASPYNGVIAGNKATRRFLYQLTKFCLTNI